MVTRLKSIDQKVENHVNGAVWAFDYSSKMFCVLMEVKFARKGV